jgi:hypothetical protein
LKFLFPKLSDSFARVGGEEPAGVEDGRDGSFGAFGAPRRG